MKNALGKSVGLAVVIPVVLAAVYAWCAPRVGDKGAAHPSVALTGIVSSDAEGPDGRRHGQGQASGWHDYDIGGQRRARPICVSSGPAEAGDYTLAVRATGLRGSEDLRVTVGDDPPPPI